MSTLATLFVEDFSAARKLCEVPAEKRYKREHSYDIAPVIDPSTLASLLAIVRKKKYQTHLDDEIEAYEKDFLTVYKVPDEIVSALVKLDKNDLTNLSRSWRSVDHFFSRAGRDVTAAHLKIVLVSLREAAICSVELNKDVLVLLSP